MGGGWQIGQPKYPSVNAVVHDQKLGFDRRDHRGVRGGSDTILINHMIYKYLCGFSSYVSYWKSSKVPLSVISVSSGEYDELN